MAKIRFSKSPFFIFAPFICWFSLFRALDRAILSLSSSENQKLKFLKLKKIRLSEEQTWFPWQKFDFQKNLIFYFFSIFICWFSLFTALDRVIFSLSSSENQKLKFLKVKKIRLSEDGFHGKNSILKKNPIFYFCPTYLLVLSFSGVGQSDFSSR